MLRRSVKMLLSSHGGAVRSAANGAAAMSATRAEKWDLMAGVLVERLPVITATLKPIEKEYLAYLNQIEFEQSLKSDFEMREEKDRRIAELQKQGKLEIDMDVAVQQTAQDLKDMWKEELSRLHIASRETDADRRDDRQALDRKLEQTLVLLVQQRIGDATHLLLPQGPRRDGETLRQTAERVLRERCGNGLSALIYGNAPCGFYKYKYPVAERRETVGAKVFFYRAAYQSGQAAPATEQGVKNTDATLPFEWLDRAEVLGRVRNGAYADSLSQILL